MRTVSFRILARAQCSAYRSSAQRRSARAKSPEALCQRTILSVASDEAPLGMSLACVPPPMTTAPRNWVLSLFLTSLLATSAHAAHADQLLDVRSGDSQFRASAAAGTVLFERLAVVLQPLGSAPNAGVRIDFPASTGRVMLEARRAAPSAGDRSGRQGWEAQAGARYEEIRYRGVSPGVDLVCRNDEDRLSSDLVVAAGSDPSAVRLRFRGIRSLSMGAAGRLEIDGPTGMIVEGPPVMYQEREGGRVAIPGGYRLIGQNELGFWVGSYDRSRPLHIGPVLAGFSPR
jgi:hypothetical protein